MDILVGCRNHLLGQAAILALVAQRVYTPRLPEKLVLPAIQMTLVSDVEGLHLRGPIGLATDRIQLDAWAQTRDGVQALGRLIRQRMHGFAGIWLDTSVSPTTELSIKVVEYDGGSERFEEEILGGLCRHSADYRVTFRDPDDLVLI